MRRKLLSLLLAFTLVLGMLPAPAMAAEEASEKPVAEDGVYLIDTPGELLWFAKAVNNGQTALVGKLTADIDLTELGTGWPGIGIHHSRFTGSFDGQGHTVTFKNAMWGLFGYVKGDREAIVTIKNVKTLGTVDRSAIAHCVMYTHITGCINRATITNADESYVGGIVGSVEHYNIGTDYYNDVLIENCGNEASITVQDYAGGILGQGSMVGTKIRNCYNTGNIDGRTNVGGITGFAHGYSNSGLIENCYNTGRVTGTSKVAGIVGEMMNGAKVKNCYNAGSTTYAIAGFLYNHTSVIENSYFLGTNSAKSNPDYIHLETHGDTTNEVQYRATAKSSSEMSSADMVGLLGSAFVQSCPTPVLAWQTIHHDHTGYPCEVCGNGKILHETYDVSFQTGDGYVLTGPDRVERSAQYGFSIEIMEGFETYEHTFAIKVNGVKVQAASDGKYYVDNVTGPLSVTVMGVQAIEGTYAISLPSAGYGYRIEGSRTAMRDEDYVFDLTFVDGFAPNGDDFKVVAREIISQEALDNGTVPPEVRLSYELQDGVYTFTLPKVTRRYQILVSGVKAIPTVPPVTVSFSITEGYNNFHKVPGKDTVMMDQTLTVPYFDLSLYGLERYYYNPYCYQDANGKAQSQQKAGTPEDAYNHITLMHAYIVATEIYRLGYDPSRVGTGESYRADPSRFSNANPDAAISWTQGVGSSFMDFWEHGTNMNYYVNYTYPLGFPGWGSTSDQILIYDGDDITLHLITGRGSGSRFGVFTVNDADGKFQDSDIRDEFTVDQGQKVKLTLYWTNTTSTYNTKFEKMGNQPLYWLPYGYDPSDVSNWNRTALGVSPEPLEEGATLPAPVMSTDANGNITINTAGVAPGTYYIGALGGFTEGGGVDQDGFVSTGAEAGASYFKLTINEYNGKLGDADGDTLITGNDALLVLQYVAGYNKDLNEGFINVDGDDIVTGNDALEILRYVAGYITSFENSN